MATRNLALTSRVEDVRELRPVALPIQFSLEEIKQHFDESLEGIKGQYSVADLLLQGGNERGGKTIWRSQVVLVEGLLDFYLHEISMEKKSPRFTMVQGLVLGFADLETQRIWRI